MWLWLSLAFWDDHITDHTRLFIRPEILTELRILDILSPLRLRALVVLSSACLSWSDPCQEPLTHIFIMLFTFQTIHTQWTRCFWHKMALKTLTWASLLFSVLLCSCYSMCCYYCLLVALTPQLSSNLNGLLWSLKVQQWSDMWLMMQKGCFNGGFFELLNMSWVVNHRMSLILQDLE